MRIGERLRLAVKACLILSLLCQQLVASTVPMQPLSLEHADKSDAVETCGGCGCCHLEVGQSSCPCCQEKQIPESQEADCCSATVSLEAVPVSSRPASSGQHAVEETFPENCGCVCGRPLRSLPLDSPSRRADRSNAKSAGTLPRTCPVNVAELPDVRPCLSGSNRTLASLHFTQRTLGVWLL